MTELSDFEKEVMEYIWQKNGCSISEIHDLMRRKCAYTTLATIVHRLQCKKMVIRRREKKGFVYLPKISRIQYATRVSRKFIASFFSSYGDSAFASFAESIDKLPEHQRKHLLRLLRSNREE